MKNLISLAWFILIALTSQAQNFTQYKDGKGKFGFKDSHGNIVIPAKYDEIDKFNSDGFAVLWLGDKAGLINKNGEIVIPIKYKFIDDKINDGLIEAKLNDIQDGNGILDTGGRTIVPFIYERCAVLSENFVLIVKNAKQGIWYTGLKPQNVDDKTRTMQHPGILIQIRYDGVDLWGDYLIRVELSPKDYSGSKYGLFDLKGNKILACNNDYIGEFKNGLAEIKEGENKYYIDTQGVKR